MITPTLMFAYNETTQLGLCLNVERMVVENRGIADLVGFS